ncbi:TetR/AcrR family transcriptional regulator [Devosia sp.]|uniref:TetR/AcrR family transcriptional regulator n=1 Tax=Devosia sp. TaxID=1871048 RepID=UPI0025F4F245|nr:TetR/AcrR family transcriptional regulator [Devosia sp.]MCR6636715.1 TetR/AcrR family transcriptional regulator [Devosia sp.]
MPPKDKGRPSKQRATELGDEIIVLALTHFRLYGYEATTIAGLAKALECSKHTIYRRFPDKEALFAAALAFDRKIVLARVASIDTSASNSLHALRQACHALFELALEPDSTDLYRACIGAVQQFPAVGRQFFQTEQDLQSVLAGALQQAQADGYIVPGPAAPWLANSIMPPSVRPFCTLCWDSSTWVRLWIRRICSPATGRCSWAPMG